MSVIKTIVTRDAIFPLKPGEGTDAVHRDPVYSYATTLIETDAGRRGTGLALTLGGGNDLVCGAIELLAAPLIDREIESLMAQWGVVSRQIAEHSQLRWLGPHKGVVHLALASITNACFDLWAKVRGVPLWQLLLDLSPARIVALLDISYLEDVMTAAQAEAIIESHLADRAAREGVITSGYPGYDTSAGWFSYDDRQIADNARRAVDSGFTALKLKVGSSDAERDVRRATIVRDTVGDDIRLMVDANQQWTLPAALDVCRRLAPINPFWIEEPTHPDDVLAHAQLQKEIAPIPIAAGEHLPNRIMFKNYMQADACRIVQPDALRLAGVSEFITVSLLARQRNLRVAPHVGDMGQLHQHLVLFNHIALGCEKLFLEYIPHLRDRFIHRADVRDGVYHTPRAPGASTDLID